MNQILATSNSSSKNRQPAKIETVIMFFVIALIVFGIFMVGTGSYAIYKENADKLLKPTKPQIEEERKSEDSILLRVRHDKAIDTIEYGWNENELETIDHNGRKYIEQEIKIPGGINTLFVRVVDINGQEISSQKQYETEDIIKCEIVGSKLKISAETEQEITYMTYRWDEGEEQKIDINNTKVEQEIDVPKGEHNITIVLVDVNNNSITKETKVKGVLKPTIKLAVDDVNNPQKFVIKVSDEDEIDAITFIINEDENKKYIIRGEGRKEIEFTFDLEEGENRIIVTAYNKDGVTEEAKGRAVK